MAISSSSSVAASTVLFLLLLLLCHKHPCSASRPQPLLPTTIIKPNQQYGDGIDPIAATQPIFPFPAATTPPYSPLPNFPSIQQQPALPHFPLPTPRTSNGAGESAPAAAAASNNNNNNNIPAGGGGGVGDGFPYQSMPSFIPKFPPFPFIPTMPTMPSVPLPRLQPDSDQLSTATPSASASSTSSSSTTCNDKAGQSQTGGSRSSRPGH